jgi:hypothetical protein
MTEYMYKGFKIVYKTVYEQETNLFKAQGYVMSYLDKELSVFQKFQTVNISDTIVDKEIQKLIENYIDFEWKEYKVCADIQVKSI